MAGLDPAIHESRPPTDVDARTFRAERLQPLRRDKPGHDD